MKHTLCLEQLYGCLFQPLYTCTRTILATCKNKVPSILYCLPAHTLLGTVIQLFIPASVHFYLDWWLTLVFLLRFVVHTLCLEQLHGCLFQPHTCVHGQTCGWLTLDKPTGGLRATLFWPMIAESVSSNHRAWKVPGQTPPPPESATLRKPLYFVERL